MTKTTKELVEMSKATATRGIKRSFRDKGRWSEAIQKEVAASPNPLLEVWLMLKALEKRMLAAALGTSYDYLRQCAHGWRDKKLGAEKKSRVADITDGFLTIEMLDK